MKTAWSNSFSRIVKTHACQTDDRWQTTSDDSSWTSQCNCNVRLLQKLDNELVEQQLCFLGMPICLLAADAGDVNRCGSHEMKGQLQFRSFTYHPSPVVVITYCRLSTRRLVGHDDKPPILVMRWNKSIINDYSMWLNVIAQYVLCRPYSSLCWLIPITKYRITNQLNKRTELLVKTAQLMKTLVDVCRCSGCEF